LPRVATGRRSARQPAMAASLAGASGRGAANPGFEMADGGASGSGSSTAFFSGNPRRGTGGELGSWGGSMNRVDGIDPETGLDVEAAWTRWLGEEDARARRFHRPATVVLVELAGLDRLVDRVGHEAAERLIPPIAATMRRYGRETDHVARLGPTRFGALLTETDEVRAINYVERIRSACDVWLAAGAISLRLAIGWAEISPDRRAGVALTEAEQRLFAERQRPGHDESGGERRDAPASLAAASPG
jgi:diguanylate cyclase (GGDEF)-like protein